MPRRTSFSRRCKSAEFDYINLHWYFVNHLNWPAIVAAHKLRHGRLHHQPERQRRESFTNRRPNWSNFALRSRPCSSTTFIAWRGPEVHTLSCGAARPQDFDEHVRGLEHYDRAAEVIAPIERRLRAEMEKALGRIGVNHGSKDCRSTSMFPARSTSWKSCDYGLTPLRWI
jgi:uncharacterized protein